MPLIWRRGTRPSFEWKSERVNEANEGFMKAICVNFKSSFS